jgi:uncharacterized protein YcfJ
MLRKVSTSALLASFVLVAFVSACSNTPEDKKLRGQIIGGATGAAVGSLFGGGTGQIVATGAGAVLGTVVGGKIAED